METASPARHRHPHAQRFQGKLRRVEPDDPAVRIGSLDTFGGKIALDRGQPGLRLRIERGTAGRHQYRPVGKIRSGCQQAVLSGLDLATDAKQVDLPLRQRVDCRLPRRKVPDAQRPLEHQGQVIGREALVGACVEDGQRRIVGETTPTVSGSRASSHCLARLSSQGRIVVVVRPSGRMDSASTGSGCRAISNRQKTADSNDLVSMSSLRWQSSPAGQKAAHPRPGACGYIGNDAAMLAGRWILFPGTHACRHSLWQPPYARLAKTLDSFASPARSMKPLAMTCALAVACLHSKAQFEPHIAEGNW